MLFLVLSGIILRSQYFLDKNYYVFILHLAFYLFVKY